MALGSVLVSAGMVQVVQVQMVQVSGAGGAMVRWCRQVVQEVTVPKWVRN